MRDLLVLTGFLATIGSGVLGAPGVRVGSSDEPRRTYKRFLSSRASVPDKYSHPPQAPLVFNGTVASVWQDAYNYGNQTKATADKLVSTLSPANATFANVLLPLAENDNRQSAATYSYFYAYVSTDPALRQAANDASDFTTAFSVEFSARDDVFALVEAAYKAYWAAPSAAPPLDAESVLLLNRTYGDSVGAGLGIAAGPARQAYLSTRTKISELETAFMTTLNEEAGGVWFTPEELAGVPDSALARFANGTGENAGKLRMTFKDPDVGPVLQYSLSPDTRRKAYVANENRAASNSALLKQAVVLRDQAARQVGFPNHAAYRLEDRMAKNPETVFKFLGDLRTHIEDRGAKEMTHLLDVKKTDLAARNMTAQWDDGNFYLWDWSFYNRLITEKEYSLDRNLVSEYFPALKTIEAMLHIFEELFGFVFVELGPDERKALSPSGNAADVAWHDDVVLFSVWNDAGGNDSFVGYLYLDIYPRDGKYGHDATFTLQQGFANADGTRHYPTAALVCNLSPSAPGKPALLQHSEVVTLFHELGHGIHQLSSRTRYSRFAGTSVAWDFVEAPSQMLENWCYDSAQLKRMSGHYVTGEPLPDALVKQIVASKNQNAASATQRQLFYALWDMTLHTAKTHEDAEAFDVTALYNSMRAQIAHIKGMEVLGGNSTWGHGDGSFGHVMSGYDAGYYGYLWSEVYSLDMFYTAFKANPANGTVGRRYRHTVLEKGGSVDPNVLLEQFLGRPANSDAFYMDLDS